jgi:flagellar hook-associated protein 2
MANVQFGGLISGLDTNALISGLVQAERRPITLLENQKVKLQAQQGVYATVVGGLGSLKSAAQRLSLATDFDKKTAASSDSTVLTASAGSDALTGSNGVIVDTLAKAQSIQSGTFTTSTAEIGIGTLSIQVGDNTTDVTIDDSNKTLDGLKSAINASGAAVTASIVNVGTGAAPDYRLVLQSKNTGTENAVTVSGTLTGGTDPFPGGGTIVQAAADAVLSVNGLTVTRSSNTISDVVPGVTLTLLKEGDRDGVVESSDASANVTVSADSSAIKGAISEFVDSYNAINEIVNSQFSLNPDTQRQGTLAGDAALRGMMAKLRSELSKAGGIGVGFSYLSDIGVKFEKDGSLTIDEAKLSNALASDPTSVSNLFVLTQNGIGKRIPDTVDDFISSLDGSLTFRQKGIESSISLIDQKIAREEDRIAALQQRLTQQFSALEQVVSQLKSQSDYLVQQLTGLNNS